MAENIRLGKTLMKRLDLNYHNGSFIEAFLRFLRNRKFAKNQKTFCWCPICQEDLCSNNSLVSDTEKVRYLCTNCGCKSEWDFDHFPFPVLLAHQDLSETLKVVFPNGK